MCQRPASTLGTWVLTHPPPLCWVTSWWQENSLYCRSVCPDNPPTCDARDWTTSHNLWHYQHQQTHTVSDAQVSWSHPLQWTITSDPVHNPTHRRDTGLQQGQDLGNPLCYPLLPLIYTLTRQHGELLFLPDWASSANTLAHPWCSSSRFRSSSKQANSVGRSPEMWTDDSCFFPQLSYSRMYFDTSLQTSRREQ